MTYQHSSGFISRRHIYPNLDLKWSVYIKDHELIAGNQSSKPRSTPVFPEFTVEYIEDELDQLEKRPGDVFKVSSETKKKLKEILSYWKGKTVRDRNLAMLPEETMTAGEDETMRSAKLGEMSSTDIPGLTNIAEKDTRGFKNLAGLAREYFDLGGMQIQFNIVSNEKLREAQKNPEEHKDLLIRVAGYSAFFVELDSKIQEDIIDRVEHGV